MAKIDRYVWTCISDSQSCANCKVKDGQEWKRKKDIPTMPPLKNCTNPEGCRCQIVPVYDDEGVAILE